MRENKKRERIAAILAFSVIVCLALITAIAVHSNPFSQRISAHDSSMFRYFGYALNRGDALYVGIFDHKGPIIFFLNYVGELLSFEGIKGIWFLELISIFVFYYYTYKISRFWNSRVISFIPIVLFSISLPNLLEGGNLTEEFALPFMAYSLFILTKYFLDKNSVKLYEVTIIGICFTLTFFLRPNMIALWVVFCGFIFFSLLFSKENLQLFHFIGAFVLGFIIVALPIGIYLLVNDALEQAVFQIWTFNILYLEQSKLDMVDNLVSQLSVLQQYMFLLIPSLFVGYIVIGWEKLATNKRALYVASVITILLSAYFTFISGRAYKHYLMMLLPVFIIPISVVFSVASNYLTTKRQQFTVIFAILLSLGLPIYNNYLNIMSINTAEINEEDSMNAIEQRIKKYSDEKKAVINISNWVKEVTEETERIYVHRIDGNIYLESERLSATKYFNLPAIDLDNSKEVADDFIKEIKESMPKIIIVKNSFINTERNITDEKLYQIIKDNYSEGYTNNGFIGFTRNRN